MPRAIRERGIVEEDMREIARIIVAALGDGFESERAALLKRSGTLMDRYPLYPHLSAGHVGARSRL
jgi:glycine/serine hydroxymethyltransferase